VITRNVFTESYWIPVLDTDPRAVALYSRHYSARRAKTRIDRTRYGFSGQGQSMVLITERADALFGWNHSMIARDDGQEGVNCFVFRNESSVLSSALIKDAQEWAWRRWGKVRLFTYINADKVRHKRDPGRCFLKAGWRKCGVSKGGLVILELLPD